MLQNKSMVISKNENKQTGPAATYLFLYTHPYTQAKMFPLYIFWDNFWS